MIAASSARSWRDRELVTGILPSTVIQSLFYAAPLLLMLVLTFQTSRQFLLFWSWDLSTWSIALTRPHYWWTLGRTTLTSMACVALCLVIAFPMAYCMVARLRAWNSHIKLLIVFSFLTDLVLKTYGWVLVLDQEGVANWVIRQTGLVHASFDHGFIFTPYAALLGMVANLLPFMIFTIFLSLEAMDRDLLLAAYDAGATRLRAFWEVTVPLCVPGMAAGSAFVFILSMGSLLEERVLGGGKAPMMGSLIRQSFETRVNWPLGATLTTILVCATLLVIGAGWLILARSRRAPQ